MKKRNEIYTHTALRCLLHPSAVAVVGASGNVDSFGARTLANLVSYTGTIYPVNPKYSSLAGHRCFPSLSALPVVPDCVIAAVPRDAVEPLVTEAVAVGAGGVVIYASGFAELGGQQASDQLRIVQSAADSNTRILGPNCVGMMNGKLSLIATFAWIEKPPQPEDSPGIGLVSQSGALGMALLQARARGVPFSHMIAPGNSSDVDVADLIAYLAEDDACSVIACVFEGISSPTMLLQAAEVAHRNRKPVLVCKIATGQEGAHAAISHTGSLAGSQAIYDALFRRCGFIAVDNFEALVEVASFFHKAPPWKGAGAAIISPSGGGGILCADWAERAGVPLPQPSEAVCKTLQSIVPSFGAARNPCDVTAEVLNNPNALYECAEAMLSDQDVGALVMPHISAYPAATARTLAVAAAAHAAGAAYCVVWMSEWLEGPGACEIEAHETVSLFRSAQRCFQTLAAWRQWHEQLSTTVPPVKTPAALARVHAVRLGLCGTPPGTIMTERPAKALLRHYGIQAVPDQLVCTAQAAVEAATAIGFPVVIKVASPAIPHKTEAAVVRLALESADAVTTAYNDVMANALNHADAADIEGVLVQPMLPAGVEVLIGGRVDPHFGPLVVVGLGGIFVELLDDALTAIAPVTEGEALKMLNRLKGRKLFNGFRGQASVDLWALANTVSAVSRMIVDNADLIAEIDVNPLICNGDRIVAVDALIVRSQNKGDLS